MKKLILLILALTFSSFSKAQDSKSEWINAADPTQLYTKIDFNAGLIASGSSGLNGPDAWVVNLGGEFAVKKLNFGFNLPFSNSGNPYSFIGDIDVHAGYQLFNSDKTFKSSILTAGLLLKTSYSSMSSFTWMDDFNIYYFKYHGSLSLNDKFSIYPMVGLNIGNNIDEDVPKMTSTGYKAGLGFNYQVNDRNFVLLNSEFVNTIIKTNNATYLFDGKDDLKTNSLLLSLKYQYAIKNNFHVYAIIQSTIVEQPSYFTALGDNTLIKPAGFLGLQHYIQ